MAWQTQYISFQCDGESLASAVSVNTDGTVGSAVETGRGSFDIDFTVSGYSGGTGFDSILIVVQSNSQAAATTWTEIGNVVIGDADGRGTSLTSLTNAIVGVTNQSDYQIRLYAYVNGSATAATVTAKIYPRSSRKI